MMTSKLRSFEETLSERLTPVERELLLPLVKGVRERGEREKGKRYVEETILEERENYCELLGEERNLYKELGLLQGKPTSSDDYFSTDILEDTILQKIHENMNVQIQVLENIRRNLRELESLHAYKKMTF